jgi:hypothetical protein
MYQVWIPGFSPTHARLQSEGARRPRVRILVARAILIGQFRSRNVDLIRNLNDLGDFLSITPEQIDAAFRDYLEAEFEVRLPPDYPEGGPVFRGREAPFA